LTEESEELKSLQLRVQGAYSAGASSSQITSDLVADGWEPGFAQWYVARILVEPDFHLDEVYARYPRGPSKSSSLEKAREFLQVASAYRAMNACLVAGIAVTLIFGLIQYLITFETPSWVGVAWPPIAGFCLGCGVGSLAAAVRSPFFLGWMNAPITILLAVSISMIPGGTILLFLLILSRFKGYFAEAGLSVGVWGPSRSDLRTAVTERKRVLAVGGSGQRRR